MKFSVKKKVLQQIAGLATRLVGKFSQIYLLAQDKELRLIINSDFYVNIYVPEAKVELDGLIGIQQEVFSQLFSLRGEVIKAEYDDKQSKLDVICGSKISIYVLDANKEDIKVPTLDESESVNIPPKSVPMFLTMLRTAKYISPDPDSHDYALLSNSSNGFDIQFASSNSCAFYHQVEPISKKEFNITGPIGAFKDAFSLCSSDAEIVIADSIMMIKSDTIIATFPTLQDDTVIKITNASKFVTDESKYDKGILTFNTSKLLEILNSVRCVSGGADTIEFKVANNKIILTLESKYGKSKDACPIIDNSIGDFKIEASELFLDSTLSMCNDLSTETDMSLAKARNLYRLSCVSENTSLICIGPII